MNRNKELGRNIIIFGLGTIGTKMVQFFLIPLYTYYLTATDYSVSDLVTSTVTLLIPFLTLGLGHGVLRFALGNKKQGETLVRFSFFITLISALALICLIPFFKSFDIFGGKEIYIPILFLFNSLSHIFSNYCKALEKNVMYALNGVITAFCSAILSWFLIVNLKMGVEGYLLASVLSNIISVIYLSFVCNIFTVIIKAEKNKAVIKDTLHYSVPLMPNDLAWWIIQMSDRYMIAIMCGSAINGIYTMAYKIPGIFNILVSIFISAFSITAFKELDENSSNGKADGKYFEGLLTKYLAITFIAVTVVILITQPVASILIKKDFYESWKYTPFLLIAFSIGNLEAFLGSIISGLKKTKINFYSTFFGAIINVILNFILIPMIGVYGAIIATIIGYFVVYIIRLIGVSKLVVMKLFFIKTLISLFLTTTMSLIYVSSNSYIRLLSLVVFVVMLFLYKDEVKELSFNIFNKIKKIKKNIN